MSFVRKIKPDQRFHLINTTNAAQEQTLQTNFWINLAVVLEISPQLQITCWGLCCNWSFCPKLAAQNSPKRYKSLQSSFLSLGQRKHIPLVSEEHPSGEPNKTIVSSMSS